MIRRDGCFVGLGKLFLVGWIFEGLQRIFGYRSGSCLGCGCGFILMIIGFGVIMSIIFGTDWFRLVALPGVPVI